MPFIFRLLPLTVLLFGTLIPLFLQAGDEPQPIISQLGSDKRQVPETQDAPPGGDFTLHSIAGPVGLQDFRGKVALLFFGYTTCPDVCPSSLSFMAQALSELNENELEKVQGLFVSLDPARDTPEVLARYVQYFHPSLIGITGTDEEVADAAKLYGVQYYKVEMEDSPIGYAINHSAVTYLITSDGALRFIFPHNTPPSVVLEAIRYVLDEQKQKR